MGGPSLASYGWLRSQWPRVTSGSPAFLALAVFDVAYLRRGGE